VTKRSVTERPRILDACCCGGGATRGYQLAGFHVTGIDINPQPNYCGDQFIQGDAIAYIREHGHEYDAVVGSPPCQKYTLLNAYNHKTYPDLIAPMREAMRATGRPYIIENVEAAASELIDPIMLCGPMFGLKIYRHRLFEASFPILAPYECDNRRDGHHKWLCTRNGYLPTLERPFMSIHGGKHSRAWQRKACEIMGTPWLAVPRNADVERTKLGIREVCESIPPAYTKRIGDDLRRYLEST